MSCCCLNTECFDIFLVPCAASVTLPILADQTGVWTMITEFNSMSYNTQIDVISGQPILIPAANLNENYKHKVRFYRPNGDMVNATCYILNTMATIFTSPGSGTGTVTTSLPITVTEDGNVLEVLPLIGQVVHDVITKSDAVYSMVKNGITFDPVTGEVDLTNIGGYFAGETITFLYEKTGV